MMKILMVIALCITMQFVVAQEFVVEPASSKLSISGTSSLHDWESKVETFKGNVSANVENNQIKSVENFNFQLNVKSIKSGKSGMDKKTYKALQEDDYPTISYEGTSVVIHNNSATFSGVMSVAGKSKKFSTKVNLIYENDKMILSGSKEFNLTDFDIDPPTAVFGTIKTGAAVVIHYNIQLKK
ncbi:YceI family protein [Mesonia ostreae]|uniref:YceI family protein n=1 Tax=Mesonia ostreae TaxID=861110 RepID=A0ABU2KM36_9FLAO|nr:YceI family protein [Mesonia ostreae]MDT0295785.1 YceI family protein [Mesonia ostreae]